MRSEEYWKRRQIREAFNVFADAEAEADEIAKLYAKASVYLDSRIRNIYEKFKKKYGLSDAEAQRVLSASSDRASIDAALRALRTATQTEEIIMLRQVVESAAYAHKIAQIRQLQASVDDLMTNVYKQEQVKHERFYADLVKEGYRRSVFNIQQRAGIAFSFSDVNPSLVDRLLHSKWSGENYSQRIWANTQDVAEKVKEQLILGVLTGKTEREMAQVITDEFASGAKQSRRLIRTESNYIFTQADMAAREECDIKEYMYLATLDQKTCQDTCAKLDGMIFKVKDQRPGYNCPPMHPWCRCTTISILSHDWIETQTRRARDPETGKTYKIPLSMTYDEWILKYVKSKKE